MQRYTRAVLGAFAGLSLVAAAFGCSKDDSESDEPVAASSQALTVTWHQDVAPIVIEKCSGCHKKGGIAPFSVEDFESAAPLAELMASAVERGTMPPFLAQETDDCAPKLPWRNDLRLSDEEKATLRAWADADAPEGDADDAAEVTDPESVTLEREDVVMALPEPISVSGSTDLHLCYVLDPKLEEDAYVIGRLITSGNEKVLHHVVSYVITPGKNEDGSPRSKAQLAAAVEAEKGVGVGEYYDCFGGPALETVQTEMLDAWAPGALPNMAPDNSGQPIDKDSLVLLDMHYHPTGAGKETDSDTQLALMLAESAPTYVSRTILIGNFEGKLDTGAGVGELVKQDGEEEAEFMIPAGAKDHVEEMTWTWKFDDTPLGPVQLMVFGMGTHMHYVGRDMAVFLETADKSDEEDQCLIQTPAWDFNWQRGYGFDADMDELPKMGDGDTLRLRCVFDNSMDNAFVRDALRDQGLDAPVDVPLGEDTLDEMCLAAIGIMYYNVPQTSSMSEM